MNVTLLTTRQWATLEALVNRIIPPDESPGGWEAGVGDYLQRQFAKDLSEKIALYQSGLDALDEEARQT
ncbi:MAG: gluconate 2-dehydrogenase subunit 3 family protein, partial [Armatimonadota bacterium]|nr:gluconate 2-dehydrogenase subunit 3 family protein [Armatimonadota bacterium]